MHVVRVNFKQINSSYIDSSQTVSLRNNKIGLAILQVERQIIVTEYFKK